MGGEKKKIIKHLPTVRGKFSVCLFLIFCAVFPYLLSLNNAFVFDDITGIVQKKEIRDGGNIPALWEEAKSRIIPNLTFAATYQFVGLRPFWYHGGNVALHALTTLTLYAFLTSLFPARRAFSLLVAVFFAVHPLATQTVAYAAQRATGMAALWYLGALTCFVRFAHASSAREKAAWYALTLLLASAAFLSKEHSASLPFLVLTVDAFFFLPKRGWRQRTVRMLPFFLLAVFFVLLTKTHLLDRRMNAGSLPGISQWGGKYAPSQKEYALSEIPVLVSYLRLAILPINQNLDYDYPTAEEKGALRVLSSAIILLILALGARVAHRYVPHVSFGVLFFFLTILPESSVIPLPDLMMEHRMYLPLVGLLIAAVALLQRLKNRTVRAALCALFLTVFSLLTIQRTRVWRDDLSVWTDVVSKSPEKARGHFNLAGALMSRGMYQEGRREFERAKTVDPSWTEAVDRVVEYLDKNRKTHR